MNMSITHYTKNTIKHNTNHSLTLQHHKLKQKSQIKTQIISNLKKNVFNNLKISVFFFEKRPEKIIIQIQKKKNTQKKNTKMNFGCMETGPGGFGAIGEWWEVDRTRARNIPVKTIVFDTFQELVWVGFNDVTTILSSITTTYNTHKTKHKQQQQ